MNSLQPRKRINYKRILQHGFFIGMIILTICLFLSTSEGRLVSGEVVDKHINTYRSHSDYIVVVKYDNYKYKQLKGTQTYYKYNIGDKLTIEVDYKLVWFWNKK